MTDPNDRSEVVITVPRTTKARWVAQSRACGQKLTDWLIERIERNSQQELQAGQDIMTGELYTSPTPADIRTARESADLTQAQAAAMVLVDLRTWQRWEYGERRMLPGNWKLFRLEADRQKR
jgi:DNA (cytosine-5)-methyltransferase 1